jgi:hypothetical protein
MYIFEQHMSKLDVEKYSIYFEVIYNADKKLSAHETDNSSSLCIIPYFPDKKDQCWLNVQFNIG